MPAPRIRRTDDSLEISVGPAGWSAATGWFAGSLVLAAFATLMLFREDAGADDDLRPVIVLSAFFATAFGLAVAGLRAAIHSVTLSAGGGELRITTRGLFGQRTSVWRRDGELAVICLLPASGEDDFDPNADPGDAVPPDGSLVLSVVSRDGSRRDCLPGQSYDALHRVAEELNAALDLPQPDPVRQPSAARALRAAGTQAVEQQLHDMRESLRSMANQLADVEQPVDSASGLGAGRQAAAASVLDPRAMTDWLRSAEQQLQQSQQSLTALDFPMYDFDDWRPGKAIRIRRQQLQGRSAALAALLHSGSFLLLALFIAPFAVPLLGLVISQVSYVWPGGRLRLALTLCELFEFGEPLLYWIPALWLAAVAAIWLRLEAALAPHDVQIDWRRRLLSVTTRAGTRTATFTDVRQLIVTPCVAGGGAGSGTDDGTDNGQDDADVLLRLSAQMSDGRQLPLLEAGSGDDVSLSSRSRTPLERLSPVILQLAETLEKPYTVEEPVDEPCDIVGFPRNHAWRHWGRVWRSAGWSGRTAVIGWLVLVITVLTVVGHRVYSTMDVGAARESLQQADAP